MIFYYYVGHFSRFVKYGSKRIEWSIVNNTYTNSNEYIMLTSFQVNKDNMVNNIVNIDGSVNDTEIVTVIMNPTDVEFTFTLLDERNDYNGTGLYNVSLPAHSIYTVVY